MHDLDYLEVNFAHQIEKIIVNRAVPLFVEQTKLLAESGEHKTSSSGDIVSFPQDNGLRLKDASDIPEIVIIDLFGEPDPQRIYSEDGQNYVDLPTSHGELVVNAIESSLGSQLSGNYNLTKLDILENTPKGIIGGDIESITHIFEKLLQNKNTPDYVNLSWENSVFYSRLSSYASKAKGAEVEVNKDNVKDLSDLIIDGIELSASMVINRLNRL